MLILVRNSGVFGMNILMNSDENSSEPIYENLLLTYEKAARCLGMSETALRKLKAKGKIPWVPVGNRGVRFSVSSLKKWIEERERK